MKNQSNPKTFEDYWGAKNLTRWDPSIVHDLDIPSDQKKVLTDVGLPSPERDIYGWQFEWNLELQLVNHQGRRLRLLGSNRGFHPVLIDESQGGRVVWNATKEGYERHINSSLEQFASSLMVLDGHHQRALRASEGPYNATAVARELNTLEKSLNDIDTTALADRNSLWSTIVQDIRRELK